MREKRYLKGLFALAFQGFLIMVCVGIYAVLINGMIIADKPKGEQKGVVTISNKNLLDPLRAVTGEDWIPGKRYKVRGFWVADAKTMCFDLNEGVQEDFRPVTPSNDAE